MLLARQREVTAAREQEAESARTRVEQLLAESESRVTGLVEGSAHAVVLVSDNRIMLANRAARELAAGAGSADVVGSGWVDFIHPDDRAMPLRVAEARQRGEIAPFHYTCRMIGGNGTEAEVDVTSVGVSYRGQPASVVIFRDLGPERAAQAEREQRVRLDGALLIARTVAHSLNNALVPVSTYAELMETMPTITRDSKALTYTKEILAGARSAAEHVRNLQRIIRLEELPSDLGPDRPLLDVARSTVPADSR
jgi:PAS domain S-box-containing protein